MTQTCPLYLGVRYRANDRSGNGHCLDTFDEQGRLYECRQTVKDGRCPQGRNSPYEEKE